MILISVIQFFLQPFIQWLKLHPKRFFILSWLHSLTLVEEKDSRERVHIEHRLQVWVFIGIDLRGKNIFINMYISILIMSAAKFTL